MVEVQQNPAIVYLKGLVKFMLYNEVFFYCHYDDYFEKLSLAKDKKNSFGGISL